MIEDGELQTVKNTKDAVSLLKHMLDSARERILNPNIDPEYRKLLENRIPEMEKKILVFEMSCN